MLKQISGSGNMNRGSSMPSFQVSCLAMQQCQLHFQRNDYLKGEEDNGQSTLCFWWGGKGLFMYCLFAKPMPNLQTDAKH